MSLKKNNPEFVVHIKNEYDYRFESDQRRLIFDSLKWSFWKQNKINLPVYGVDDKLKEYHTSKRDISQGIEVNPPKNKRIESEDIYSEEVANTLINLQDNFNQRNDSASGLDEISRFNEEMARATSNTIFIKSEKNEKRAELKDF